MSKNYKKYIFLCILISIIFGYKINLKSKNETSIEVIYNNVSYIPNEEIILNININNVTNLYEVDVKIDNSEEYFKEKNELFTFKANSIFSESPLINDYIDNVFRLKLVKNSNIFDGYSSNIKNNLSTIKLICNKKINSIDEILKNILSIKLYNTKGDLIEYEIDFNEELKYNWNIEYDLLVNKDKINILDDLKIINRENNQYEISIEENINYSLIGKYYIKVTVYDYLTNEIIKIDKVVNILDKIKPTIKSKVSEINLKDIEFKNINLRNYFELSDNYDTDLELYISYFNKEKVELSKEDFYKYLDSHKLGYINCYTKDSSNNYSDIIELSFNIIDTIAPIINVIDRLEINIDNLELFKVSDYISLFDEYDLNPLLIVNYFDFEGNEIFNITEYLKTNNDFYVKIYSIDNSGNTSNEYTMNVVVIDNISPTININNINVEDSNILDFNYMNYVKISDNVDKELNVSFYLYYNDELVKIINEEYNAELVNLIKKYRKLTFYVMAKDKSGNIATSEIYSINIIDNVSPIISLNNSSNINNINDLNIEISDNYSTILDIKYYLNDELIELNDLYRLKEGSYKLKIVVMDEALNKQELIHEFNIVNSIIENDSNSQFSFNSNLELILIICLFSVSFIILIVRVVKSKKYQLLNNEV